MKLVSSDFEENSPIPEIYSKEGENLSPPLEVQDLPIDTVSWVLVVDDPDAPGGTFDHWIAWNISPQTTVLEAGKKPKFEGTNGFGEVGYGGPMPPPGKEHHYRFKSYALDKLLSLPAGATKGEIEEAMQGHILAYDDLTGTYKR